MPLLLLTCSSFELVFSMSPPGCHGSPALHIHCLSSLMLRQPPELLLFLKHVEHSLHWGPFFQELSSLGCWHSLLPQLLQLSASMWSYHRPSIIVWHKIKSAHPYYSLSSLPDWFFSSENLSPPDILIRLKDKPSHGRERITRTRVLLCFLQYPWPLTVPFQY